MNQVYSALINYNRDQTDNNPKHKSNLEEVHSISPFEERLRTFDNWPNTQVSKRDLASAGFVYTGQDDIVACRLCEIEGYNWVSGDDPMADHRKWSPSCPFLTTVGSGQPGGNRNTNTCRLYGTAVFPNSIPEDNRTIDLQRWGIHRGEGPRHQDKTSLDSRLATFKNWPSSMKQRPAELAEAGFYYTGVDDQAVCFYCGGALKDWEESDDPWEQHALRFDKCYYLNSKKGTDFVENIQRNRDPRLSLPGTSDDKTKEAVVPKEPSSQPRGNRNTDTCGLYGIAVLPNSLPEDNRTIDLQRWGIHRGKGPRHQDKTSLDSRLATFKNWPRSMKQRPAELAEAGFYYTGSGDQAVCFYCGGCLKDWEENDDPWEQHARWFDKCVYLNLKKGTDFQRKGDPRLSLPGTSDDKTKEAVVHKEPSSETPEKVEKNTENKPSESTLCNICLQNKLDALFLPCNHIFACVDCASALNMCAVCREPVEATVRVFIS